MNVKKVGRCFEAEPGELEDLYDEGYAAARRWFPEEIHFYAPGMVHFETSFHKESNPYRFPAITVTGGNCQLQCEHCKGRLLEEMIPATTPQALIEVCADIKGRGGTGCLISGGSALDGSVPLGEFTDAIREVKNIMGLDVVVHTGIIKPDVAEALADAGIDAAMIDVIGSDETYKDIYHLENGVAAIEETLSTLKANGIAFVPHMVVGLHRGELRGEEKALDLISRYDPTAIVVVALMPLERTPMENVAPPSVIDVARVILAARLAMPEKPLLLGCARPRGRAGAELEVLAIRAGVNGIAYPSEEGYGYALSRGLEPVIHDECCALMYRDIARKRRGQLH